MFTVRNLRIKDVASITKIANDSGLSHWSEADYRDEIAMPTSIMLRLESPDDDCAGFLVGRIVPGLVSVRDAELYNIGIEAAIRRQGGGALLMAEFIARARKIGARNIWLDVRTSNLVAIGFYRSFGFAIDGRRRNFYTNPAEDAHLMRLTLSTA
ncbi:N/A [soil metagenome]